MSPMDAKIRKIVSSFPIFMQNLEKKTYRQAKNQRCDNSLTSSKNSKIQTTYLSLHEKRNIALTVSKKYIESIKQLTLSKNQEM